MFIENSTEIENCPSRGSSALRPLPVELSLDLRSLDALLLGENHKQLLVWSENLWSVLIVSSHLKQIPVYQNIQVTVYHLLVFNMTADEQLITDCTQQLPKIEQRRPLESQSYYFEIYENQNCFDDISGSIAPTEDYEYSFRSFLCHLSYEWRGRTIE